MSLKVSGTKSRVSLGRTVTSALMVSLRTITVVERHKLGGFLLVNRVCVRLWVCREQRDIDSDTVELVVTSLAFGGIMLYIGDEDA